MATQSEHIDQLATALAAAQAELLPALKDAQNPHLRNKYADLASCWDAIKACLPRHGLSVVQGGCFIGGQHFLRTTLMHASGQWISGITPILIGEGKGLNPMQVYGSGNSYARRYGLAAICGLTAEDDDGQGAGHPPPRRDDRRDPPRESRPPQHRENPTGARHEPNGKPATVATPVGSYLDEITGWYIAAIGKHGLATPERVDARQWELWNHLANAAVELRHVEQESIVTFDGKRDPKKTIETLHSLCKTHKEWVKDEVLAYKTAKVESAKLQTQEAAK